MPDDAVVVPREHALKMLGLEIVELPIDQVEPNPWNPNKQIPQVAQAERESITRFGFVDPITVRVVPGEHDRWQIIDGEHRWREARDLGYETIAAVILDVTEDEAKKLTIVLNETRGDADVVLLGQLLQQLADTDDFRVALPYTDGDLAQLLEIGSQDWDGFGQGGDDPAPPPPQANEIVLTFSGPTWLEPTFMNCVNAFDVSPSRYPKMSGAMYSVFARRPLFANTSA